MGGWKLSDSQHILKAKERICWWPGYGMCGKGGHEVRPPVLRCLLKLLLGPQTPAGHPPRD